MTSKTPRRQAGTPSPRGDGRWDANPSFDRETATTSAPDRLGASARRHRKVPVVAKVTRDCCPARDSGSTQGTRPEVATRARNAEDREVGGTASERTHPSRHPATGVGDGREASTLASVREPAAKAASKGNKAQGGQADVHFQRCAPVRTTPRSKALRDSIPPVIGNNGAAGNGSVGTVGDTETKRSPGGQRQW